MEKREVVKRVLNFREIPSVKWHFKLTMEARFIREQVNS
jgi:hypothetical protein